MSRKDARVDAYIVNSAEFARPILQHFRRLVHQACPEVSETIKWSHPHFLHGGMMCSFAAFKEHCSIGFWRPEIRAMVDGHDAASKTGMGQFGKVSALTELPPDAVLIKYIKAAAALNESGQKVERKAKPKPPLVVPAYFQKALKAQPKAHEVFQAFSPSKQREYVEWLTEAKTDATRDKRLATAVEWIAEGKSRNWKYQNC